MPELYRELSLAAQTAYAELLDQARTAELDALAGLTGAFAQRTIKGRDYVYFGYRDPIGGVQRRIYVGPADERVTALIERYQRIKAPKRLAPNARAAIALGCRRMRRWVCSRSPDIASRHLKGLQLFPAMVPVPLLAGSHASFEAARVAQSPSQPNLRAPPRIADNHQGRNSSDACARGRQAEP